MIDVKGFNKQFLDFIDNYLIKIHLQNDLRIHDFILLINCSKIFAIQLLRDWLQILHLIQLLLQSLHENEMCVHDYGAYELQISFSKKETSLSKLKQFQKFHIYDCME